MSTKNLSTVATNVIETYGITVTNVINAYRFGGERFIGFVDNRVASAVSGVPSAFGKSLRSNLIDGQKRVSGYSVKGLHLGTDGAQRAVGVAVDLATKGVSVMAANAVRMERATNVNALNTLNRVAMPAAELVSQVAEKLEEGSSALVKRVSGKDMPAKAVATRKLTATTRKAAAARKQVTRSAKSQVNKQVKQVTRAVKQQVNEVAATRKRITRKATTQVNQAVAAGQKIKRTATKRVSKAVAETATDTSNAARRVARKANATAAAA